MALNTSTVQCPYCGENIETDVEVLDDSQSFIEDCSVCCRPIQFTVGTNPIGELEVTAARSD